MLFIFCVTQNYTSLDCPTLNVTERIHTAAYLYLLNDDAWLSAILGRHFEVVVSIGVVAVLARTTGLQH